MLYVNLLRIILTILAENGETRTLTIIKLINNYTNSIKVEEPMVFEHIIDKSNIVFVSFDNIKTDWGDGQVTYTKNHIYAKLHKKYRVKIYCFGSILISAYTWPNTIINFISIGRIGITTLKFMFYQNHLRFRIQPNWDISGITDTYYMFYDANNFNQKIGDNWDTSQITNMSCMFLGARSFNQRIGDNWDTSNVRDMSHMFCDASNFNQRIGDNWDTSNVRDMSHMFRDAWNFNQRIGDNWDTSNVTDMNSMFWNARSFNQKFGDNWDTSQVRDISYMFRGARNFKQKIGDNWDISNLVTMIYAFGDLEKELLPVWYKA